MNQWYDQCEFIEMAMQFYSYDDFMNHYFLIKKLYKQLPTKGKNLYRYYVFSKRYISISKVAKIWEMLNN